MTLSNKSMSSSDDDSGNELVIANDSDDDSDDKLFPASRSVQLGDNASTDGVEPSAPEAKPQSDPTPKSNPASVPAPNSNPGSQQAILHTAPGAGKNSKSAVMSPDENPSSDSSSEEEGEEDAEGDKDKGKGGGAAASGGTTNPRDARGPVGGPPTPRPPAQAPRAPDALSLELAALRIQLQETGTTSAAQFQQLVKTWYEHKEQPDLGRWFKSKFHFFYYKRKVMSKRSKNGGRYGQVYCQMGSGNAHWVCNAKDCPGHQQANQLLGHGRTGEVLFTRTKMAGKYKLTIHSNRCTAIGANGLPCGYGGNVPPAVQPGAPVNGGGGGASISGTAPRRGPAAYPTEPPPALLRGTWQEKLADILRSMYQEKHLTGSFQKTEETLSHEQKRLLAWYRRRRKANSRDENGWLIEEINKVHIKRTAAALGGQQPITQQMVEQYWQGRAEGAVTAPAQRATRGGQQPITQQMMQQYWGQQPITQQQMMQQYRGGGGGAVTAPAQRAQWGAANPPPSSGGGGQQRTPQDMLQRYVTAPAQRAQGGPANPPPSFGGGGSSTEGGASAAPSRYLQRHPATGKHKRFKKEELTAGFVHLVI